VGAHQNKTTPQRTVRATVLQSAFCSPNAAASQSSLLPHTKDVRGGISKRAAAIQSEVSAFTDGGVADKGARFVSWPHPQF